MVYPRLDLVNLEQVKYIFKVTKLTHTHPIWDQESLWTLSHPMPPENEKQPTSNPSFLIRNQNQFQIIVGLLYYLRYEEQKD